MNRHPKLHRTAKVASPEKAAGTGFKSLDELRAVIRSFSEWNSDLGIPRPMKPLREKSEQDPGSES